MLRMFNLRKWATLSEGSALSYAAARPRVVKFEVNAPSEVMLHIRYPDGAFQSVPNDNGLGTQVVEVIPPGTTFFLATVKGRETLETFVDANFELVGEGGTCYLYTADGDDVSSVVLDPVIFTRIAERRARNPEIEAIERRMYLNQQARLDQQMADMERRYGGLLSAAEERMRHAEARAQERERATPKPPAEAGGGSEGETGQQASEKNARSGSDDKASGGKADAAPDAKKGSGKG